MPNCSLYTVNMVHAGKVPEPGLPCQCPAPWPRQPRMPATCVSANYFINFQLANTFASEGKRVLKTWIRDFFKRCRTCLGTYTVCLQVCYFWKKKFLINYIKTRIYFCVLLTLKNSFQVSLQEKIGLKKLQNFCSCFEGSRPRHTCGGEYNFFSLFMQ